MSREYTGERFLPDECQGEMAIEHYQRYQFARQLVKGKKVLDAACGEGYGSNLLTEEAASVTGLDLNEEAVKRASRKYANDRLAFYCGSIAALPFEDNSFDAVVSFETIEHVEEELQKKFLSEIQRVLKPEGILIMSTPNKAVYTDLVKGNNSFHIKEFYVQEFREFLGAYFENIEMFCQYPDVGYFISKENKKHAVPEQKGQTEEKSRYVIAVCSHEKILCEVRTDGLTFFDDRMYYDLNRYVHEKEQEILTMKTEAEAFEKQLEDDIRKQKEYIAKLENDICLLKEAYESLTEKLKHPLRHLTGKMKRK